MLPSLIASIGQISSALIPCWPLVAIDEIKNRHRFFTQGMDDVPIIDDLIVSPVLEAACTEAVEAGICHGDVILTILARQLQPPPVSSIAIPEALVLKVPPLADCARYDSIRKVA